MWQPILTSDRFAAWFNSVVTGAYRKITVYDIRDMTQCGLIGRYGYYGRSDLEIVRAVLQYEHLRENREQKANTLRVCKRCGASLPDNGGVGRPKEYCDKCESFRGRERWWKWHKKEEAGCQLV